VRKRWRSQTSDDATDYLTRIVGFGGAALAIEEAVEAEGVWEDSYEWRMATDGTDRIERGSGGYAVTATHHGTFTAAFESLAEALDALGVLSKIQKDLFYALGWASWAGPGRLSADDPPRRGVRPDERFRYLVRLSEEAQSGDDLPAAEIGEIIAQGGRWNDQADVERSVWINRWTDWDGAQRTSIAYAVSHRSLRLEADSPTLERAVEFIGIFRRLQADLARVLKWHWL
jgi:hypothetical protein